MVTYTTEDLLREVQNDLGEGRIPPDDYLLSEYTAFLRSLVFSLPGADAVCLLTPADGVLHTDLCPAQVRRVLTENRELFRGSCTLMRILPHRGIYCPTEEGILVTVTEDCTVYYRKTPATDLADAFPLDIRYLPLVRAYLLHRACLYVGDSVGADMHAVEYNRLLDAFRAENGVRA